MVHQAVREIIWVQLLWSLLPVMCSCQDFQGVRLAGSTYGNHTGRVEVFYNGTWGAVCSDRWRYDNARTICRQLNFPWAVCTVPRSSSSTFGAWPENGTVWITDISCDGTETSLNECSFRGYDVNCVNGPAHVFCQSYIVGRPSNLTQTAVYSSAISVEWTIPTVPVQTEYIRHRVFVSQSTAEGYISVKQFFTRQSRYSPTTNDRFNVVIHSLDMDTEYRVKVRTDVKYLCTGNRFMQGKQSVFLTVHTAEERRISEIPIRLVPPAPGVNFMGRVEVLYNNTWGTVCDDGISTAEATVICQSLNFSEALCHVRESGMGRGQGPIWMDNVDCFRGADVLEDCDFNGWGIHNCEHDADIGVICVQEGHLSPVEGLIVDRIGATTIAVSWNTFAYPPLSTEPQYQVEYSVDRTRSIETVPGTETSTTLTNLQTSTTYRIRVQAEYRYPYCNRYASGAYSETVRTTTIETAPTAPPSAFHVLIINSTALEFQWELPLLEYRNGVIQGYRLFLRPLDQNETQFTVDNQTMEYIINGLTPSTVYSCSILAFTVGDGPRSLFLTVTMPGDGFVPLIIEFGLNGDGYDRATVWPSQRDIRIHCRSGSSSNITWYNRDGTPVGTNDRNMRQVTYADGTAVLQIATKRRITYCDAGVYACIVNDDRGRTQRREFTLLFSDVPPRPSSPYPVRVTSAAVTIAWEESACDGGHKISGFNIRYRKTFQEYLTTTNMYIYNVNPLIKNYTIIGLESYTAYNFSVQAISAEYLPSEFSLEYVITTAPEAPSPPRFVRTRIVAPLTVEIQWSEPAEPNGILTAYTIYVSQEPDISLGDVATVVPVVKPFSQNVSASVGSINITVSQGAVQYVFTVSATAVVGGDQVEGEQSLQILVYVPSPEILTVENLRVAHLSNSTMSLTWDYPEFTIPIEGFWVTYRAAVEWRSQEGFLVNSRESKEQEFPSNRAVLTALTPETEYEVSVSALTEKGPGPPSTILVTTMAAFKERLAYFQLMIGPIKSCVELQDHAGVYLQRLHNSLLAEINTNLCPTCGLGEVNIRNEEISCRPAEIDRVFVYRARIVGTDSFSASDLVEILAEWVTTGDASVLMDSVRFHIYSQCVTRLDRPSAPDCAYQQALTTTAATKEIVVSTVTTQPTPSIKTDLQKKESLSRGEIGGLIIGVLLAVLLLIFIALLVVALVRCFRSDFRIKMLVNEDVELPESTVALDNPIYDSDSQAKIVKE